MSANPESQQQQRSHADLAVLLLVLGLTREQLLRQGVQFVWDANAHRYWSLATESIISPAQLRTWVDASITTTENRIQWLTRRLINGNIDFPTWATLTQQELKAEMTGLAQIAIGGGDMWGPAAAGRFGQRMRFLYQKLTDLGLEFERGEVSEAQMLNRTGMAVHFGRNVFETLVRGEMIDAGFEMERNVLAAGADHCEECPALTDLGWQPIDSLPMIGERICVTRDLCSMEYEMSANINDDLSSL